MDISAVGYTNATEGAKVTLAVQYSGGDGNLFQVSPPTATMRNGTPLTIIHTSHLKPHLDYR